MKTNNSRTKLTRKILSAIPLVGVLLLCSTQSFAELSSDVQTKLKIYHEKLASWAEDPDIIQAVKSMNSKNMSMNNATWKTLAKDDPVVEQYIASPAGKKLSAWKQDEALGKLFLRDKKGNFVAGSNKPAIYNISDRPPFKNAISGTAWSAKKAKKDPTTQRLSVQLSHPVISDGENIGIIHTAIILQ